MAPLTKKAACPSLLLTMAVASAAISPLTAHAADIVNNTGKGDKEEIASPPSNGSGMSSVRQALHDWDVVVGGGAIYQPKFEGSSEYEITPVPFFSAQFYDRITIDVTGVAVKAYQQGPFQFDLKLGYDTGRDDGDADRLRGLGDIDFAATVGGKATYSLGPAELFLSVDQALGGSDGLLATAGISAQRPLSERVLVGAQASVTYADENYMQAFFGVDAGQSARSGLAEFDAEAGIKSAEVSLSATYLISDKWFLRAEESVSFLMGDAADSPIVEEDVQAKTLLLLGYRF